MILQQRQTSPPESANEKSNELHKGDSRGEGLTGGWRQCLHVRPFRSTTFRLPPKVAKTVLRPNPPKPPIPLVSFAGLISSIVELFRLIKGRPRKQSKRRVTLYVSVDVFWWFSLVVLGLGWLIGFKLMGFRDDRLHCFFIISFTLARIISKKCILYYTKMIFIKLKLKNRYIIFV